MFDIEMPSQLNRQPIYDCSIIFKLKVDVK